jgi:hypothetical protein
MPANTPYRTGARGVIGGIWSIALQLAPGLVEQRLDPRPTVALLLAWPTQVVDVDDLIARGGPSRTQYSTGQLGRLGDGRAG